MSSPVFCESSYLSLLGLYADFSGSWAAEQAAIDAEKAAHEVATTGKTKHKGSVANMSLGGGRAKTLDDAVDAAVEAGLHFAVAAGK